MSEILDSKSTRNWYHINEGADISPSNFFELLSQDYPILRESEFNIKSEMQDGNLLIQRYTQNHRGFEIIGSDIRVHNRNGKVFLVNGIIAREFTTISESLTTDQVEAILLETGNCNNKIESIEVAEDNLHWVQNPDSEEYELSLELEVGCHQHMHSKTVYVGLSSKKLLMELPHVSMCRTVKSHSSLPYNNGIQRFHVINSDLGYELIDTCRHSHHEGIITTIGYGSNPHGTIYSSDNSWKTGFEQSAAQCHWGMTEFNQFLQQELGRNSWDNEGGRMLSVMDTMQNGWAGFVYTGMYSIHGKGQIIPDQYWASLDVVGHEWTHAVIFNEGVLMWNFEGQAITEGICDVFGTYFEFLTEQTYDPLKNGDWLITEDLDIGAIRDLQNPLVFGISDTYRSVLYHGASNKYERSGPMGYWFYLLSAGGSGINQHNQNPYSYSVNPLGMKSTIQILYRSMTHYLTAMSNYSDLRLATEQAAEDLFGLCSYEYRNVVEAWKAVGVYNNLIYCQSLAVENTGFDQISIYPNPGNGNFRVQLETDLTVNSISVLNAEGIEVYTTRTISNEMDLQLNKLPAGVYFLRLIGEEQVLSRKLLIR